MSILYGFAQPRILSIRFFFYVSYRIQKRTDVCAEDGSL